MNILENINDMGENLFNNLDLSNLQENFLKTEIGKIANTAVNIGLKTILPDFIENEVIEVKDSLIYGGIKEGINTAIENAINLGKKALGIDEREFKFISQAENAIEIGGVVSNISNVIDSVLNKSVDSNKISQDVSNKIKDGKELVLNNISTNIEDNFLNQMKAFQKIEKYIDNWKKYYDKKDVEGLDNEYKKIQTQMKKILPLENIIKNVNKIENINKLIKNSENFDFNKIYLDLANNI